MKSADINDKDNLIEYSFFSKTPERKLRKDGENIDLVKVNIFDKWKAKHQKTNDLLVKNEDEDKKIKRVIQ